MKLHYLKILGLKEDASKEDIKKAFRKKAKLLHPDKNPSKKAQEEFIELCEAYEALTSGNIVEQSNQPKAAYYSKKYNKVYSDEELEQKLKKAKQYAEFKKVVEKNIHNIGYQQMLRSKLYKTAVILGIITIFTALILSMDYLILPKKQKLYYVSFFSNYGTEFKVNVKSAENNSKYPELTLDYSIHDFNDFVRFKQNELIQVNFTSLFNEPVSFSRYGISGNSRTIKNESSFYVLFWPITIMFYLPLLMFVFRGKNSFFLIITPVTIYLSSFGILLLIYSLVNFLLLR